MSIPQSGDTSQTVIYINIYPLLVAPQLLVDIPVNSTVVNVSWSEVQCFNGSETVSHYLVQYWSICNSAVKNVTTNGLVQTVSGLTPNCVYTFRVAAVGVSQKIGRFSSPVNTSLPGECRRCSNECFDYNIK